MGCDNFDMSYDAFSQPTRIKRLLKHVNDLKQSNRILDFELEEYYPVKWAENRRKPFNRLLYQELTCALVEPVCDCLEQNDVNQNSRTLAALLEIFSCQEINYNNNKLRKLCEKALIKMKSALLNKAVKNGQATASRVDLIVQKLMTMPYEPKTMNHLFLRELLYCMLFNPNFDRSTLDVKTLFQGLSLLLDNPVISERILEKNENILNLVELNCSMLEYGNILLKIYGKRENVVRHTCEKLEQYSSRALSQTKDGFSQRSTVSTFDIGKVLEIVQNLVKAVIENSAQLKNGISWSVEILQNESLIQLKPELTLLSLLFINECLSHGNIIRRTMVVDLLDENRFLMVVSAILKRKEQFCLKKTFRENVFHKCRVNKEQCWCHFYKGKLNDERIIHSSESSFSVSLSYDRVFLVPLLDLAEVIPSNIKNRSKQPEERGFKWPFSHHWSSINEASRYYLSTVNSKNQALSLKERLLSVAINADKYDDARENIRIFDKDGYNINVENFNKPVKLDLEKNKDYSMDIESSFLSGVAFTSSLKEAQNIQEKFIWEKFTNHDVWDIFWKTLYFYCCYVNDGQLKKVEDEIIDLLVDTQHYDRDSGYYITSLRTKIALLVASVTDNKAHQNILQSKLLINIQLCGDSEHMSIAELENFPDISCSTIDLLMPPFRKNIPLHEIEIFLNRKQADNFELFSLPLELVSICLLKRKNVKKLVPFTKTVMADGKFKEGVLLSFIGLCSSCEISSLNALISSNMQFFRSMKDIMQRSISGRATQIVQIMALAFIRHLLNQRLHSKTITLITECCTFSQIFQIAIDNRNYAHQTSIAVSFLAFEVAEYWIRSELPSGKNEKIINSVMLGNQDFDMVYTEKILKVAWLSSEIKREDILSSSLWNKYVKNFSTGTRHDNDMFLCMLHCQQLKTLLHGDINTDFYWRFCSYLACENIAGSESILLSRLQLRVESNENLQPALDQALVKISHGKSLKLSNYIVSLIEEHNLSIETVIFPLIEIWFGAQNNVSLQRLVKQTIRTIVNRLNSDFKIVEKRSDNPSPEYWISIFNRLLVLLMKDSSCELNHLIRFVSSIEQLKQSKLEKLNLVNGNLENANILCSIPAILQTANYVTDIDLSSNKLGNPGAITLASWLSDSSCKIRALVLRQNKIGPYGTTTLADSLRCNVLLETLDISENLIAENGDESGLIAMAESLIWNTTLTNLDISYNTLTQNGLLSIMRALRYNGSLKQLNLMMTCASQVQTYSVEEKLNLNALGITQSPHIVLKQYLKRTSEPADTISNSKQSASSQRHVDREKAKYALRVLNGITETCQSYETRTIQKSKDDNNVPQSGLDQLVQNLQVKHENEHKGDIFDNENEEKELYEQKSIRFSSNNILEEEINSLRLQISELRKKEKLTFGPP